MITPKMLEAIRYARVHGEIDAGINTGRKGLRINVPASVLQGLARRGLLDLYHSGPSGKGPHGYLTREGQLLASATKEGDLMSVASFVVNKRGTVMQKRKKQPAKRKPVKKVQKKAPKKVQRRKAPPRTQKPKPYRLTMGGIRPMALNVHLILIDEQEDFVNPNGALFVKGAEENVKRVAKMIERVGPKFNDIHLTMDSHRKIDISHPMWWVDRQGKHPKPFTVITPESVEAGDWRTFIMTHRDRSLKYLKALKSTGRYAHVIWPEHCLIGDQGHNIAPVIAAAVHGWEEKNYAFPDIVTKGSNPWTEHFSAVRAEVPDPEDDTTQINQRLVTTLEEADVVAWAGEALSHCLAHTFRDTIAAFSDPEKVRKMVLLRDGSSPVGGFENLGEDFVRDMRAKGMQISTTTDFLA